MGDSITCTACGHGNRVGARFCEACGAELEISCPACGNQLRPGASFCDACGSPAVRSAPAEAASVGETRKVVTVVFADLVASTALQEKLDAEAARRIMARFYDRMRAVIEAHGGSVQKFIGDAVVAAFGVPELREDDALRAVRAAAGMVAALEELGDELEHGWGVRLQMRTAVNTGELVVSDEGILIGDTMNTAARLEQAAAAGEVLVGEPTWRLVHHAAELEPLPELELRGKAVPVRAWRLVSVARADRRRTAAVDVPLVGRSDELARLQAAFDGALAARECRLVTVMGSPGVGKTRLAREFDAAVADVASVVEGTCEPTGEGITFLPVAEVIRVLAAIGETDPADVVREKLGALVGEDEPDRERVVDRVAGVLGFGEPASAQETFWALRRGLESLARARPVVLVLDDLHWGQPMLLDLVEHLVEWVSDAPILIVALARPELRDVREALAFTGRRARDVIELQALDPGESRELVAGLLSDAPIPAELSDRILETTEGNPLFLGETVRMLIDEGALRRDGDGWAAGTDLAAVEVPPTIQALLAARIERLRGHERSVIERAAVIGKQFYRGAVAELVAPPVRDGIDRHLDALRRKDMVEPEGTYWIDEPVYRFHHVLIRDAAYRSLLKEARAELHERFADWLELKAGELVGEHEEVIAFHLEQAHEYRRQLGQLDERGNALGVRAAERLHSAGRRALAREDLAAAANLLLRALQRASGRGPEILWDLCEAQLSAGDTSAAARSVRQLAERAVNDRIWRARTQIVQGQLAHLTGAGGLAAAADGATAAASALAELGDRGGEAKGFHVAAAINARLGRIAAVEDALDRALGAGRAAGDRRRTTAVLAVAPRAALWGPSPVVRASGRCLDVVRILRMTAGNRHVEAVALRCQAVLEAMRGRAEAAREILAAGRATLEELGLSLELNETAIYAGIVELLAGDPVEAIRLLRAARQGFQSLGVAAGAAQAAALLARALVAQGDSDQDALEQTMFAEEHAGEDLQTTIIWCSARGEALARMGDCEQALSFARRAVALAEPTDALADKGDASLALARVELAAGNEGAARRAAGQAKAWYEAKGHVVGAERAARLAAPAPEPARRATSPDTHPQSPGDRPPERVWRELARRWAMHDIDALLELYAEDWVMTDHRAMGWEPQRGRAQARTVVESVFAIAPDVRLEIDEVLACDERVIAMRVAYRGHAADGSGYAEYPVGYAAVVEAGISVSIDQYDHDDDRAMIARYAELGGGLGPLGDRPPERWWKRFARGHTARELEPMLELYADGYENVDHRSLGWEATAGSQDTTERLRSIWRGTSHFHLEVNEVLACDERVIALRITWTGKAIEPSGGGKFAVPMVVVTLVESGRALRMDQYEEDDREAALTRYRELGGRRSVALGDRPPERYMKAVARGWEARDADALVELHHEASVTIDHRALSKEDLHGRADTRREVESMLASSPDIRLDVDEVLACDERVIAARVAYRGHASDGMGEAEVRIGVVNMVQDGLVISRDQYEHDDDLAIIARYAELGGGLGPLGDRPPERHLAAWIRAHAARDLRRLKDLATRDYHFNDRRRLGWESRDALGGRLEISAAWKVSAYIHTEVDEVLACDERVIATRLTWRGAMLDGGGRYEIPVGLVILIDEAGRAASWDQYEPDDREAMLARFGQLSDRASEVVLGDRPPERWYAEFLRDYAAHDLDRVLELYAEDFGLVDHRAVGWDQVHSRNELHELYESAFAASPAIRVEVDEVLACDERVIATRIAFRGEGRLAGQFEDPMGHVTVVENGRCVLVEVYDYHDRDALVARYEELRSTSSDDPIAPDVLVRDRRGFPTSDRRGGEAYRTLIPAATHRIVVAREDEVTLTRVDGDPPLFVVTKRHEGRVVEAIVLREARRAREWTHALALWLGYERAARAGDADGLLVAMHPEARIVDHRPFQFQHAADCAGIREIYTGLGKLLTRPSATVDVIDLYPGATAYSITWSGIDRATGGEVEWTTFHATRLREGLFEEVHSYSSADEVLAKIGDLSPSAAHARIARLFVEAYNARDWDELRRLYTDDCVVVDHRPAGWEDFQGADGLITMMRSLAEMVSDHSGRGEILDDGTDELFTLRQHQAGVWQGAPWEIDVDTLTEVRDGRVARVELFNPDQEELRLARVAKLRPRGASAPRAWEAPLADHPSLVDRRPDGWGLLLGAEAVSVRLGRRLIGELLAACEGMALARLREDIFALATLNRAGEAGCVEIFAEPGAARARYEMLAGGPDVAASIQFGFAWFDALNRRDRVAARACLVEGLVVLDHRPASGIEVRDAEAYLDLLWSLMELSEDIRWYYTDTGLPGTIGHCWIAISGHWNTGGGEAEIPIGVTFVVRDDRFERIELYPPEATSEMQARVAELIAGR